MLLSQQASKTVTLPSSLTSGVTRSDDYQNHLNRSNMPSGGNFTSPKNDDRLDPARRGGDAVAQQYAAAFAALTEPIQDSLLRVEERIHQHLLHPVPEIQEILSHVAKMGGKRLRPALLLLAANANQSISEEAIRLSVVVELVHTATLVHDDVLDNADLRRHQTTVHRKWNRQISILIGDWLFTQAYHLANMGQSTLPGRWVAQAAKEVCEGEIRQNLTMGDFNLTEPTYFEILAAKTGALCGVSCALGAWSAGVDEVRCKNYYDFGSDLGLAFQVQDDWLDYWGVSNRIGKPLGGDLKACKPTLPLIHLLNSMSATERAEMIELCKRPSPATFDTVRGKLEQHGSDAYTAQKAVAISEKAIDHLRLAGLNGHAGPLEALAIASVARRA